MRRTFASRTAYLRIMSRLPVLLLFFIALLPLRPLCAQTNIDIGVSVGEQRYRSSLDSARVLTGAELLVRGTALGVQLAVEYADLSDEGALVVLHPDLVYRLPLGARFAASIAAGPTLVTIGGEGGSISWNAALELERRWGRTAVFARVRQYDYELDRGREGDVGPNRPAIYAGVRFAVGR